MAVIAPMKRVFAAFGVLLVLISAALGQGRGYSPPDPFVFDDSYALSTAGGAKPIVKDVNGLTRRDQAFNPAQKTLVALIAGQSNCTSQAPTLFIPTHSSAIDNFNVYDGASWPIAGPLLGTQNLAGSPLGTGNVAARIAENFVAGGYFDRVVLVPLCVAGSTAAEWATGSLKDRIPRALARLASRGYIAGSTGLTLGTFWFIGESDNPLGTSSASFQASFATILANAQAAGFTGSTSRMFINRETWNGGVTSSTIQGAQAALVNGSTIFAGYDADANIGAGGRADTTHWNDSGAATVATGVVAAAHASGAPY